MAGHDFLENQLALAQAERSLALCEGENAILREVVRKLKQGDPLTEEEHAHLALIEEGRL